jgi:hypothetical protein
MYQFGYKDKNLKLYILKEQKNRPFKIPNESKHITVAEICKSYYI